MSVDPSAPIVITAYDWVPPFAQGQVRDYRARWACEEIGLDYAERLIPVGDKPAGFWREQPWNQVPVLHDHGIRVFESGAILLHLAQKSEILLPADPQARALAISWVFGAFNSIEPLMFELINVDFFAKDEEWAKLRRPSLVAFLGARLDRIVDSLADKDWLEGVLTVGDLAMASVLRIADYSELLRERPSLDAYVKRAMARPAFERAIAAQMASFKQPA